MAELRDVARASRALWPRQFARAIGRAPLLADAEQRLAKLPRVELTELTGHLDPRISLARPKSRHAWSLGFAEQIAIQVLVSTRGLCSAFEIGTFNGGTTRLLAEATPDNGRVVTIDLPPDAFDRTQAPDAFAGNDLGRDYTDSPAAYKVTQLFGDSLTFDPSPFTGQFDLVLVDGGHEFVHGVADSRTALTLVAPGGLIVWDDFEPHWHGLVRGITEAMRGKPLCRLAGTSLGVFQA